jgi:hypothetical protein
VKDQSFIVEPNPNWPGNMRVDIRDERWQQRHAGFALEAHLQIGVHRQVGVQHLDGEAFVGQARV